MCRQHADRFVINLCNYADDSAPIGAGDRRRRWRGCIKLPRLLPQHATGWLCLRYDGKFDYIVKFFISRLKRFGGTRRAPGRGSHSSTHS